MIEMKKQGELDVLEISNQAATAKIALQGGHLYHFQRHQDKPLLWLSETSFFKTAKAIRGGIPICWPWFGAASTELNGNNNLPSHGFARTFLWEYVDCQEVSEHETIVTLMLKSSTESLKLWPYQFELSLKITIADTLRMSLRTKNCDARAFKLSQALHSYFAISDITTVYVDGLDGKGYFNKVNNSHGNIQQGILNFKGETDNVYQNIDQVLTIIDNKQSIAIESEGCQSAIVWNPGGELAQNMADLSDYKTMLCVESGNVMEDERLVEVGECHTLSMQISQKNC